MEKDYNAIVEGLVQKVYDAVKDRVSPEDFERIKDAYAMAKEAHAPQRRKSGEPYIIHPVSVALIAADELQLDANSVITAFLHDVVEDTPYTIEDIRKRFGDDVAGLVDVVTKKKKDVYNTTKQVDNYQQILDSLHYDIRAVMVKISDRLHNMRTLSSMRPDKQMKIAGETDCFYAPLANRLGLFDVKSDLENLSFKFRCGLIYSDIEKSIEEYKKHNNNRLSTFCNNVHGTLKDHGILCSVETEYRRPYSLWRKMEQSKVDIYHLPNPYYIRVTFWGDTMDNPLTEKETCLKIYNLLTRDFRERPGSFSNLIDNAKENSYECLKVMLLSETGVWEDVQICSEQWVKASKVGCMTEMGNNIGDWIKRFRNVLKDISYTGNEEKLLEHVSSSLYYDDITVFSPDGKKMILPKDSTVIDYAYKHGSEIGDHAHFARVNGKLCSVKTVLNNGDCVELHTNPDIEPHKDWIEHCKTYAAKRNLRLYIADRLLQRGGIERCPLCKPLPGGELIGIRMDGIDDNVTDYRHVILHRRSCPEAIRMASKHGDNVVCVDFEGRTYPVTLKIQGIDRYHLLSDLVEKISDELSLEIDSLCTTTNDCIVDCKVTFMVHSVQELVRAIREIYTIEGIDSVYQIED